MDKNKIIFISIISLVLAFILLYATLVLGKTDTSEEPIKDPGVPELKEEQAEYSSKLEAVNAIKEKRASNSPSIYDEALLDSTGLYDPMQKEKERQRIVDSIYRNGQIDYDNGTYANTAGTPKTPPRKKVHSKNNMTDIPDFPTLHKAFFSAAPENKPTALDKKPIKTDAFILVEVHGEQTVKEAERLELRLAVDAQINNLLVPRNSLLYGFVSFKANRVFINITNIHNLAVDLKAFDLLDGNEGIYVRNSIRGEVNREVIDDIVQDVNIPGVPQIGGIKQVFRRNNRNVTVTIHNQYQLILKPTL